MSQSFRLGSFVVATLLLLTSTSVVTAAESFLRSSRSLSEEACLGASGTVETASCCATTDPFPPLCTPGGGVPPGSCNCDPENSQDTLICTCPEGACWDGRGCFIEGMFGGGAEEPPPMGGDGAEVACTAAGGTVTMQTCACAATDFPDTCTMEECPCAGGEGPETEIKVCTCPGEDACFDGFGCVVVDGPDFGCLSTGGTVVEQDCACTETTDFPNTCAVGACSCPPGSGEPNLISVCDCPTGACFDGTQCTLTPPVETPTEAPVDPPTTVPVDPPTDVPVDPPTEVPVEAPTEAPIEPPTDVPVEAPTEVPIEPPTDVPVEAPTEVPIEPPTDVPVEPPTDLPVEPPTDVPVEAPTDVPVEAPMSTPTPATCADLDCPDNKCCLKDSSETEELFFSCSTVDQCADCVQDKVVAEECCIECPQANSFCCSKNFSGNRISLCTDFRDGSIPNIGDDCPFDFPPTAPMPTSPVPPVPTSVPGPEEPTPSAPVDPPTTIPINEPTEAPDKLPTDVPVPSPSDSPVEGPDEPTPGAPVEPTPGAPTAPPADVPTELPTSGVGNPPVLTRIHLKLTFITVGTAVLLLR